MPKQPSSTSGEPAPANAWLLNAQKKEARHVANMIREREAIAIAARVPVGRFGAIEVRPVMTIEPDKR